MLTTKKLLEKGFDLTKESQFNWYLCKNNFCLFPMNGGWSIGSNFGELAIGPNGFIEIIETEEDFNRYLLEKGIKI
jgi:hypothetical protein